MNRRNLLTASLPALAIAGYSSAADDKAKPDSIRVEVDGHLGSLVRQEGAPSQVSASILAGGGELFLDTTKNKEAHQVLVLLAEKHLKGGSTGILLPRMKVKGRLEFRNSHTADEEKRTLTRTQIWVLVPESIQVLEFGEK